MEAIPLRWHALTAGGVLSSIRSLLAAPSLPALVSSAWGTGNGRGLALVSLQSSVLVVRGLAYCDVLRQFLREVEREDLIERIPPFNVFLELGVSLQTQIALIGVGLSRTSSVALSEIITEGKLTEPQVLQWLRDNEELWRNFPLPSLVKKEVERVLKQHKERAGVKEVAAPRTNRNREMESAHGGLEVGSRPLG